MTPREIENEITRMMPKRFMYPVYVMPAIIMGITILLGKAIGWPGFVVGMIAFFGAEYWYVTRIYNPIRESLRELLVEAQNETEKCQES